MRELEKKIIERDASEQRALSAELNARTAFVLALFVVDIGFVSQSPGLSVFPFSQLVVVLFLVSAAGVLVRGQRYSYVKPSTEWIAWVNTRVCEVELAGDTADHAFNELESSYWTTLMETSTANRKANQAKSRENWECGFIAVGVLIFVLVLDLASRLP